MDTIPRHLCQTQWEQLSERERTIELRAERFVENEILACQSGLIDMLFQSEAQDVDGFEWDDVENTQVDPSEWDDDECREWLADNLGHNPDDLSDLDLDELRDEICDHAEPAEVYEWWLVTGWLCGKLREIGEPVLDNGHGCWWGRTCTGQAIVMDGTLQRVAGCLE